MTRVRALWYQQINSITPVPDRASAVTVVRTANLAVRLLFERLKVVVEPSGASAVAAALVHAPMLRAKRIGIIVSGGNVSARRFGELLKLAGTRARAVGPRRASE